MTNHDQVFSPFILPNGVELKNRADGPDDHLHRLL